MSQASQDNNDKNYFEDELNEENVILTLVPVTEEPDTEQPMEPLNVSSSIGLTPPVPPLPTSQQPEPPRKFRPGNPPPATLPPINNVSRNTLREWCRYHNLSTDGKKVEVYLRIQRHSYSEQKCHIPDTSLEARMKPAPKRPKISITRAPTSSKSQKQSESGVVEVLTSARESVFAAWGKIAMKAFQPKAVNCRPLPQSVGAFLSEDNGCRWCVVHGKHLPADRKGWVHLQFHAGQTWVPDTPQRMISLFLLPACIFPAPGVEDNLLCPECVQSNKKMMRNLTSEGKRNSAKKNTDLPLHIPPQTSQGFVLT
ncbi:developmental pluripotency-associated protein 2 [Acomys russatus]|uniref:developmental pluripotency-associated protein 2 n=1 Tax=Acomys russatus TaxID=60746 RepID=UPI0021E1C860|nr:developmental pluripotency-associated protein 2 [Acomys russatus]